jgi:hypothetical protein
VQAGLGKLRVARAAAPVAGLAANAAEEAVEHGFSALPRSCGAGVGDREHCLHAFDVTMPALPADALALGPHPSPGSGGRTMYSSGSSSMASASVRSPPVDRQPGCAATPNFPARPPHPRVFLDGRTPADVSL